MNLRTMALAAGLAITGNAHAVISMPLSGGYDLGPFSAPTVYVEGFSVSTTGTFNHDLTFAITSPLYGGSSISDLPLSFQFGSFTLSVLDIQGLEATIFDSNGDIYKPFVKAGSDPDYLTLPSSTFFSVGNYTLNVSGYAAGSSGGTYTVAAATVPVPEPETWAMLLAGMGLVALRVRQKAKAAQA